MIAAGYGTVSDIEIMFTLSAALGLALSLWTSRRAWGDWRYQRRAEENGRKTIARTTFLAETTRAVKQAIFLMIGLIAATQPEPPNVELSNRQALISFVIRWGLIVATLLTTFQSILAWDTRRELEREDR